MDDKEIIKRIIQTSGLPPNFYEKEFQGVEFIPWKEICSKVAKEIRKDTAGKIFKDVDSTIKGTVMNRTNTDVYEYPLNAKTYNKIKDKYLNKEVDKNANKKSAPFTLRPKERSSSGS